MSDTAAKTANSIGASTDYLVKNVDYQNINNKTVKRMKEQEKLSKEDKAHVFFPCKMLSSLIINLKAS